MTTWLTVLAAAWGAPPEDVHVDLLAGTTLPLAIEGVVQAELPGRVRVGVGVGGLPGGYVDLINAISEGAGWYDPVTGDLIAGAIDGSVMLSASAGWRPLKKHGLFFGAGWRSGLVGGGLTGTEVVNAAAGVQIDPDRTVAQISTRAALHQVTAEVGWEQIVAKHFVIRASLGGAFTVAAPSDLSTELRERVATQIEPYLVEGESYLTQTMKTYVHTPTIGLHIGYRFF